MVKFFLGIDIAKNKFDVALLKADNKFKSKCFSNSSKGFIEFRDWTQKYCDTNYS